MTRHVRLRARLPAPTGAAWRALTDPAELTRWLAEHAAEPYAFWGRHTPEGDEPRQRLLHRGDGVLRFSWRLHGQETTTEIRLEELDADATAITITQTCFDGEESGYPADIALTVFWSLAVGNLIDHLTGRPLTPRCDWTATDLRAEVVIGAPRDRVFASLTESGHFSRWFGLKVELDARPGGTWTIHGGGPIGTVGAVRPGRLLTLEEDSGVSTWRLDDDGDGTLLSLGLAYPGGPPYPGWTAWLSAVSTLRRYHEVPCWRSHWLDG